MPPSVVLEDTFPVNLSVANGGYCSTCFKSRCWIWKKYFQAPSNDSMNTNCRCCLTGCGCDCNPSNACICQLCPPGTMAEGSIDNCNLYIETISSGGNIAACTFCRPGTYSEAGVLQNCELDMGLHHDKLNIKNLNCQSRQEFERKFLRLC